MLLSMPWEGSVQRGYFFATISPEMGKDLSGVHRNMSIGICLMHSHTPMSMFA